MRIRSIPTHRTVFQFPVPNAQSPNYASCVYWQLPLAESDAGRLFAQCVEESLFDKLRTKRQMGYIVWSLFSDMAGSAGFLVIVQSNSFVCREISQAIVECVEKESSELETMTDEEFQAYKDSICNKLLKRIITVKALGKRLWKSITDGNFDFKKQEHSAQHIQSLTKEDMKNFVKRFILNSEERRQMVVEYGKEGEDCYSPASFGNVSSSTEFKKAASLLPVQWKEYENLGFAFRFCCNTSFEMI